MVSRRRSSGEGAWARGKHAMKVKREPIDPRRVRSVPPEGFSWVDRRFLRDGFADALSGEAILLYFFLSAVSDAKGLSFYGEATTGKLLKLDAEQISRARMELVAADLILYRYPLYQVLPLPTACKARAAFRSRGPSAAPGEEILSLGEILRLAQECVEGGDGES